MNFRAVLIFTIYTWSTLSISSACEYQKKLVLVPISQWDINSSYNLKKKTIYLPDNDVLGVEVYPAFKPKGYHMAEYRFFMGDAGQGVEAYMINYYGKAVKGRSTYQDLIDKFRAEGFEITLGKGASRKYELPVYRSNLIWFEKAGIAGSVHVADFHDSNNQEWSVIEYLIQPINLV